MERGLVIFWDPYSLISRYISSQALFLSLLCDPAGDRNATTKKKGKPVDPQSQTSLKGDGGLFSIEDGIAKRFGQELVALGESSGEGKKPPVHFRILPRVG